jgi:hypothetical protein
MWSETDGEGEGFCTWCIRHSISNIKSLGLQRVQGTEGNGTIKKRNVMFVQIVRKF